MDKDHITGEDKVLRRKLTDDEMSEIIKTKYQGNERGPKTEKGQRRALENLKMQAPKEVKVEQLPDRASVSFKYMTALKVLNEDELNYFTTQWDRYYDEFEMNKSSDESLLFKTVMAEIVLNRLYREQLMDDITDQKITEQIQRISKVHDESLKSLGATRKERLGSRTGLKDNIASLIQDFDEGKIDELRTKRETDLAEEDEFLKHKNEQLFRELEEFQSGAYADEVENEGVDAYEQWLANSSKDEIQEGSSIWDVVVPQKVEGG